jgi:hypothetical protein
MVQFLYLAEVITKPEFSEKKFHKDNKVKLKDWFGFPEFFDEVKVTTYGKSKKIEIQTS